MKHVTRSEFSSRIWAWRTLIFPAKDALGRPPYRAGFYQDNMFEFVASINHLVVHLAPSGSGASSFKRSSTRTGTETITRKLSRTSFWKRRKLAQPSTKSQWNHFVRRQSLGGITMAGWHSYSQSGAHLLRAEFLVSFLNEEEIWTCQLPRNHHI